MENAIGKLFIVDGYNKTLNAILRNSQTRPL